MGNFFRVLLGLGFQLVILVPRDKSGACFSIINSNFHVVMTGLKASSDRESNRPEIIF